MRLERITLTTVRAQVYWDNGCQIVAPHDKGIAKCIEENLQPWDVDVDALLKQVRLLSQHSNHSLNAIPPTHLVHGDHVNFIM